MKKAFKVLGKVNGAALTLLGIVGIGISAVYWLDLDDKAVAKMGPMLRKTGKMKEMMKMKKEYEAQQAAENSSQG